MNSERRRFLEAASLTIGGLWKLTRGLATIGSAHRFIEWAASWRGTAPVIVATTGRAVGTSLVVGVGDYAVVGEAVKLKSGRTERETAAVFLPSEAARS